jgi:hypothetical protein
MSSYETDLKDNEYTKKEREKVESSGNIALTTKLQNVNKIYRAFCCGGTTVKAINKVFQ